MNSGVRDVVSTLIVDDEPLARSELRRMLTSHKTLRIDAEAEGVEDAFRLCGAARAAGAGFDLLLLDIEMPDGTGFDLLEKLGAAPDVVFVTAYDQHAVRAFRSNALDYLVKPVDPRDLAQTVARLLERRAARSVRTPPERLFVKDGARAMLIRIDEIRSLEAAGDYARIAFGADGDAILSARSLAALEALLPPERFFRASRQQVVAVDRIARIEVGDGSRLVLRLDNGERIEMSERRSQSFRSLFG